jgi:RNA polymerase sigma factor (sigma-70 family)
VASSQLSQVIAHLRNIVLAGGETDLTDGQLLDCFIDGHEEAALAGLARRHGPMVWGVCRRILRSHHDAEDAFQATFLVLVRRAESIVPREMVANWLHGVARQTALKARAMMAKRQARERRLSDVPEPEAVREQDCWAHLPTLDQQLSRLPGKYRAAIIFCNLEGKTRKEAARQPKIPEGTLSSRLTTAKALLAKRLARHGLTLSAGGLAALFSEGAAPACVPSALVSSTIKAVTLVAVGKAASTGVISANVAALTEGVLKAMYLTKLKIGAAVVLAATVVLSTVTGLLLSLSSAGQPDIPEKQAVAQKPNDPPAAPGYFIFPVKTDLQRALVRSPGNLFVFVDTTKALTEDQINPDELKFKDLEKDLLAYKKEDTKLQFCLYYPRSKLMLALPPDSPEEAGTVREQKLHRYSLQQDLLHYALIGFGHEIGFSQVTAVGTYHNDDVTWSETIAAYAGKAPQPEGDEPAFSNKFVKAYPVRTAFSRCLTDNADCLVVIMASPALENGAIPQTIREATTDLAEKLKLANKKRVMFDVRYRVERKMRQALVDELDKLAKTMGFETSTVSY